MSFLRPLRSSLFKYRKGRRASADGSVLGAEYNQLRGSTWPPRGSARTRGGGYTHQTYLGDLPRKYHPNINAPAAQSFEYATEEPMDFPVSDTRPDLHQPPSLDSVESPGALFRVVEDNLSLEEQFLMNQELSPRPQEGPIEIPLEKIRHLLPGFWSNIHDKDMKETDPLSPPVDILTGNPAVSAADLPIDQLPDREIMTTALDQLRGILPDEHPDIVNLTAALERLEQEESSGISGTNPAPPDEAFLADYELDPIQAAEEIFERQMQELNETFELPEDMLMNDPLSGGFDEQQVVLEQMLESAEPDDPFLEQQSLEQIIEPSDPLNTPEQLFMEPEMIPFEGAIELNGIDSMPAIESNPMEMIHAEIDQAIDQVSGQSMAPEPMSEEQPVPTYDPLMEDLWQMQQYMVDPYLQQGMNPTMMPDEYGPMGPMPGFGI